MGRPAAESAQRGMTQRCAILGNLCDMVGGKEVLGALAAHSKTYSTNHTRTVSHKPIHTHTEPPIATSSDL